MKKETEHSGHIDTGLYPSPYLLSADGLLCVGRADYVQPVRLSYRIYADALLGQLDPRGLPRTTEEPLDEFPYEGKYTIRMTPDGLKVYEGDIEASEPESVPQTGRKAGKKRIKQIERSLDFHRDYQKKG